MGNTSTIDLGGYLLENPQEIETPAFLVYEELVNHNIQEILKLCEAPNRIVPHFKTHKSVEVLKLQMEAGMTSFKCSTLREAEILAENGVTEIIIAYPLVHPKKIKRFVNLTQRHSDISCKLIISKHEHLKPLSDAFTSHNIEVGVYIDLDTGMHRTGAQPGKEASELYHNAAHTAGISVIGVHVFDGHTLYKPNYLERKALVDKSLEYIYDLWESAIGHGHKVLDTLVASSWSFQAYLGLEGIRVSPGTWIYWDSRNSTMTELPFKISAVVLGQVVDKNIENDTITVDIGSKAITPDQPMEVRLKVVGHEKMELVAQSEEHGVIKLNGSQFQIGDMILAQPGHACTTTVKYPYANTVNSQGKIIGRYGHQARDR